MTVNFKGNALEKIVAAISEGIGSDDGPHIMYAEQALAELQRRIERLKGAADAVYTCIDSATMGDLDTALNVLETGIEDCR